MRVVIVASESAPYLKTGGLVNVIHSFSKALTKLGHTVYVIMPKYAKLRRSLERKVKEGIKIYIDHQWREFNLYEDILDHVGYFFIDYMSALLRARVFYEIRVRLHHRKGAEVL